MTDDSGSYIKTDNDSIVRPDDEDAELYDNLLAYMYISCSYLRLFEDNVVVTDDSESYIKTDNDSIVRTDDEDAELYDNHPKVIVTSNQDFGTSLFSLCM